MYEAEIAGPARELRQLLDDKDAVFWVGSGISREARNANGDPYPEWKKLIETLCQECGVDFPESATENDFGGLADRCKARSETAYNRTLGRLFGGPPLTLPDKALSILQLTKYFLITTNFDRIFVRAMERLGGEARVHSYPNLPPNPRLRQPYLVHLHGLAPESSDEPASDLVLAQSEFELAYKEPSTGIEDTGPAYRFLSSTLPEWTVLFVAYSLSEQEVRRTLEALRKLRDRLWEKLRARRSPSDKSEWVLVVGRSPSPDPNAPQQEQEEYNRQRSWEEDLIRRAGEAGIGRVVEYPRRTRDHTELRDVLDMVFRLGAPLRGEVGQLDELEDGRVVPGE